MLMETIRPSRRAFLAGSAGLVVGFYLAPTGRARAAIPVKEGVPAGAQGTQFAPNAFVRIAPDDTVTVLCKHTEIGQGVYTGLPTIVAEELDADWGQMRAVASPADDRLYKNLAIGIMVTGGSTAIANSYTQMRMAGATARAMLVAAAAEEWGVPKDEIIVESGRIRHTASGHESGFGAFAEKAAAVKLLGPLPLKNPKNFKLIGSDIHRLDTAAKSRGEVTYTIDIHLPDMLTALMVHPDVFGAKVKSFDDSAARQIPGVVDVKAVPQGVAVYAESMWAAIKGRAAVKVEWDTSTAETRSSAAIVAEYQDKAKAHGVDVANTGDLAKAFGEAKQTLEAEYVFPYLAHSPMEPLDSVMVKAEDGTIDIYSASQLQTTDLRAVAGGLGLDPGQVRLHTQLGGGGFGRRGEAGFQYSTEAAAVFKASGGTRPIKHIWLRENDVRGGNYRPIYVHRLKGAIAPDGTISAWEQVIVGQSILTGTLFEGFLRGGPDPTSHEGASDLPYSIANRRVSLHTMQTGVPVLWWRSVGHSHTAYSTECFLDELLAAAGKDPVEGRLAMLGDFPRHSGVLKRVGEMAGSAVPEGRARGVAVHKSFNTYVAQIAEISNENGLPRVNKVWCAVDCGVPVNPNVIRAQMEGGIGFGLSATLFGEISLGDGGRIQQSNFHDYRILRINEMPEIEVAVIPSTEAPTGVGEPGVPPVGPAVSNAWRRLTGQSVRQLPFQAAPVSGSLS